MHKKLITSALILAFLGLNIPSEAFCAVKKSIPIPKVEHAAYEYDVPLFTDQGAQELKKYNYKKQPYKKVILADEAVISIEKKSSRGKKRITPHQGEKIVLKPLIKTRTSCKKVKFKHHNKIEKYEIALPEIGDIVPFQVMNDVKKDGEILIKKGTIINAEVSLVSPKALGGAPAEIILENLTTIDKDGNIVSLPGKISRQGYSLALFIGIVELATTPFIFGFAAPLMRFAPGGQAVLTPRKKYEITY